MYATPAGLDRNARLVPFSAILGQDHRFSVLLQLETAAGGLLAWDFRAVDGSITVDRKAKHRRQVSLEAVPYDASGTVGDSPALTPGQEDALRASLIPARAGDPTSPYGNTVRVWYGVSVPGYRNPAHGNDMHYWHMGLFRISEARVSDDGAPRLHISGYDRSRTISRSKLTRPWVVAAGTNTGEAIEALARDRLPGFPLEVGANPITATMPATVVDPEQDPWDVITEWAASAGCDAYFDADDRLTLEPVPDPTKKPVSWVYGDGGTAANALIQGLDRSMTDEPGYNGVVLTSESTTIPQPIRSEVWDLNPSSPTYALGAYGRVPKFVSNPYVTTQAQGDAAAAAELQRSLGGTEVLSITTVPNPAHEAGDVVRVVRPLSKTDQLAAIESFDFPLGPGDQMRITCQETRSLS